MASRPALAEFIDEEMLRAPLLFDAVIDEIVDQWRGTLSVAGRSGGELARVLLLRRGEVLAAALHTLRLAATRGDPAAAPRKAVLSLVDESDIVADVEVGRCAERIKSEAESELRDIHAYTSALAGDLAVSRDTNPLRPEFFARALWDACQAMPAAPAVRLDAFHRATAPLARCVRSTMASACERLHAQGVTPATYRTLVFPPAASGQVPERVRQLPVNLTALRDSMMGALDAAPAAAAATPAPAPAPAPKPPAPGPASMMHRLYDEIAAEGGIPPPALSLLGALRPAFERIAQNDAGMVDSFDHPVWRLIDRIAFTVAMTPASEQHRLLGLARNLIAHLVADPAPDAARFAWAADKLEVLDQQSLALALHGAREEIHRLERSAAAAAEEPASDHGPLPLDFHSLDTVPGDLLDAPAAAPERGSRAATAPGDRMRVFLQGEWRSLQLLWSRDDLWLLRDLAGGRHWALRPGVIESLAAEHLVTALRVRSLVRRAAERLQRSM